MDHTLEKILARVQKPGRYVGGEYNAVMKNKDEVDCRFAFCFPDTYEKPIQQKWRIARYHQLPQHDFRPLSCL